MTELNASLKLSLIDEVSPTARRVQAALEAAARGPSAELQQLRLKQLEATQQTRQLEAEMRKLQASDQATEEQIRQTSVALIRAREAAAEYAAAAVDVARAERSAASEATKEASALRTVAAAEAATAGGTAGAREETRKKSRAVAENINLVTELTLGLGALDPRIQQVAISFAGAGNNAFQLANFLGPIPLVVTTIVTALPALIGALRGAGNEMEDLGRAADNTQNSFAELRNRIREMREEERRAEQARRGELDLDDQETELATARAQARAARDAIDFAQRRAFGDRADAPELLAVIEEATRTGRAPEDVLREHAARGVTFGRLEWERSSTSEINLGNAARTLRNAMAEEQLGILVGNRQAAETRVRELESSLEQARARVRAEQEREAVRSRPEQIRQQLSDLATAGGLTDEQGSALVQAAERGRAIPEALLRRLGGRGGRAADLARELRTAERAAAISRLEEAETEDVSFGLPAEPLPQVRQRIARRRTAPSAAPQPSGPTGPDWDRIATSLETIARTERRQVVRVEVEDRRVHHEIHADASASDLLGGQQ